MRRLLSLLLFLLPLLPACASSPVRPDRLVFPPLVFHVPQAERLELANGIRLYIRQDSELPLVEVTAMIGAGEIGDPPDRTGLAQLFATTLRTGGAGDRSADEFDRTLERMAADLAVSADTYAVTVGLSLQAQDLEAGLGLLADLLRRPAFAAERLELARKQSIEAVRRQNDEPEAIAARALARAIYGDHPLGRSPTVASLAAVDRADLLDFQRRYLHPNNLWLAVSGDFDPAELRRLLERSFGDWPRADFTPQPVPPVPAAARAVLLEAEKEIPQATILRGELGIDKDAPDLHAVRVMNYILGGGGFNSRLMREIRSDRGLAYSVYSHFQIGRRLPGPFLAGCETKTASVAQVVRLMGELIGEMRARPVSEEELALARESLINSFVFGFTDSHEVVSQIMRLDFYGYPPDYLETYRDKVAAVTADQVLQAARHRLDPARQAIVLVGERAALDAAAAELGMPATPIPRDE